jgi:hypothetical protein
VKDEKILHTKSGLATPFIEEITSFDAICASQQRFAIAKRELAQILLTNKGESSCLSINKAS